MDIDFTEEQEMLRTMARDFFVKECPGTLIREIEATEEGYSKDLWAKMAELGWMGMVIPEQYDGIGNNYLDLVLLLEEMGRAAVPSPFFSTVVLGAIPIMKAGTDDQKQEFLPKIANGDLIVAFAYTEPDPGWSPNCITVSAKADGDTYVLNGTKLFVEYAHIADYLMCVARTKEGKNPEDGLSVFLVDIKSPGIELDTYDAVNHVRQSAITFNNVKVPAKSMLGKQDEGWPLVKSMLEHAATAKCAEMIGGGRKVVEMAVDFVKDRIVYDRPLASFQVVQHQCVDMRMLVDLARSVTYETAWRLSEDIPCSTEVAACKAWTSDAYFHICKVGSHLHGAMGFTWDHDIGLYYRREIAARFAFGNSEHHWNILANQLAAA
ncbi:MAG: acyl-CoA dehydrogenase family protein [Chloroflexota bacterium]|nr:acyl-CoA dehydrogenase family protein [Chloroflexota bacterium]